MNIQITSGTGSAPTKLGAFDAALNDAGIANFNLLVLSSVIPPKSKLIIKNDIKQKVNGEWGDRLYLVLADKRVDTPNEEAWAGLGWVQDEKTGKGLFVEHVGNSEESVRRDINQSLEALMTTRNIDFGKIQMKLVGKMCSHLPVCVLVAAIYQSESWT